MTPPDEPDDDEPPLPVCEVCHGSGTDPWESFLPCPACDGEGVEAE